MKTILWFFFAASLLYSFEYDKDTAAMLSGSCVSCHRDDDVSNNENMPKIIGQPRDYLFINLQAFKSGERKSTVMGSIVKDFSDDELEQIAHYFSVYKSKNKKGK